MIGMFEQQCMESFMCQHVDGDNNDNSGPQMTKTVELTEKQHVNNETTGPNNPVESIASFQVRIDRRLNYIENYMEKLNPSKTWFNSSASQNVCIHICFVFFAVY